MNPAIEQRIAEEQAKINVPSYQDVAWDGAWKRRSNSMWGLSFVGGVTGAALGSVALIPPAIIGAVPLTLAAVGTSAVLFGALGISTGFAVGAVVGPAAGAAASTMKEFERRTLEDKIIQNPEAEVTLAQASQPEPSPVKFSDLVNIKTGALFAAIGAVGGLIFATALSFAPAMAAQFAMPAMNVLLGEGASAAAITAYSVGLGASFGAIFGVHFPRITRLAADFAGDLLSGKAINAPWPESANLPELKPILSPQVDVPEQAVAARREFKPMASYQDLIVQQKQECEPCQAR
jgi:hypothetical protein